MTDKISLDLSDIGISVPAPIETNKAEKAAEPTDFGMPVSISLMVQVARCLSCNAEHREHQGVCVEVQYRSHRLFRKMERWEGQLYRNLPRRIEYQTPIALDFCSNCFVYDQIIESIFDQADKENLLEEASRITGTTVVDAHGEAEPAPEDYEVEDHTIGAALVGAEPEAPTRSEDDGKRCDDIVLRPETDL